MPKTLDEVIERMEQDYVAGKLEAAPEQVKELFYDWLVQLKTASGRQKTDALIYSRITGVKLR